MKEGDAIKELADVVESWFDTRSGTLKTILEESDKEAITLKHPGGEIELSGDKLKGFRAGLQVAAELFDKLPFTLQEDGDEDEDEDPTPVLDCKVPETPKPEGYGIFS